MNWIGISGSWRYSFEELHNDVTREVEAVLHRGDGIVSGGALGVDYIATAVALEYAPDGSRIKIFLPTTLEIYTSHYRKRANEGVITMDQAESLIKQLQTVNDLGRLSVNHEHTEVNPNTYYLRNTVVLNASNALLAFQVNRSEGTQDTIDKARELGMPVTIFTYEIDTK